MCLVACVELLLFSCVCALDCVFDRYVDSCVCLVAYVESFVFSCVCTFDFVCSVAYVKLCIYGLVACVHLISFVRLLMSSFVFAAIILCTFYLFLSRERCATYTSAILSGSPVHLSILANALANACMCAHANTYVYTLVHTWVYTCADVCVCTYVCVHVHMYACMYVCVCICAHVCS